jgi:hypothetical protein
MPTLEDPADFLRGEVAVDPAVDEHGRRPVAIADAADRQQGEQPVGGRRPQTDPERAAQIVFHRFITVHPADDAVAYVDHIRADRLPKGEGVEGGELVELQRRHAQQAGRLGEGRVVQVAVVVLDGEHYVHRELPRVLNAFYFGFQPFFDLFGNIKHRVV